MFFPVYQVRRYIALMGFITLDFNLGHLAKVVSASFFNFKNIVSLPSN